MFVLDEKGRIKVSKGDTFTLNVIPSLKLRYSDSVILTIKKDMDDEDFILQKTVDEFFKTLDGQTVAIFKFQSDEIDFEPGNYYYDIKLLYPRKELEYTAMWPTRFTIVDTVYTEAEYPEFDDNLEEVEDNEPEEGEDYDS